MKSNFTAGARQLQSYEVRTYKVDRLSFRVIEFVIGAFPENCALCAAEPNVRNRRRIKKINVNGARIVAKQ